MASNKTPNLNLDIWAEMDFFKRAEVNSNFNKIDAAINESIIKLATTRQYPILAKENGVKSTSFSYGDIRRYGATDSTTVDSSVAIQNAINSAYALGVEVVIPEGTYRVDTTIKLPASLSIKGVNASNYAYSNIQNVKSKLINYAKNMFEPSIVDDVTRGVGYVTLKMNNLYIHNSYSPAKDQTLFNKIEFKGSNIEYNVFHNHGTIFHGSLINVSYFNNNRCTNIGRAFLDSRVGTRTDGILQDINGLVDSYIEKNYLNGDGANNITMFQSLYVSASYIRSNFMDFCKHLFDFGSNGDMIYDGNSIDFIFQVWKSDVIRSTIVNNLFGHISPSYLNRFVNADAEMTTGEWWVINRKKANRTTIANNRCSDTVANFVFVRGWFVYNLNIYGNNYETSIINKVKMETSVSDATKDNKNIYIDEFMNKRYATLPNPKLNSTALDTNPTVTFDGMQIIYNGKILFNDNGQWKDATGTVVTA